MIFVFWSNKATKNRFVFKFWIKKNTFWTRKRTFLKTLTNRNFLGGLVHGFVQKIELFIMYVFWANQERKDRFLIFSIKKNAFQTRKMEFQKSLKNRLFAKGLVHCFCQKIDFFIIYVFCENLARKDRVLMFWIKRNAFQTGKKKLLKSPKSRNFPNGFCEKN